MTYRNALKLFLVLALCAAARAEWTLEEQRYYALELGGARAGSLIERVLADGDRLRSESETRMSVDRGAVALDIEMAASFEETAGGAPLVFRTHQDLGMQPVEQVWRFEPERVIHTVRQGGRETVREVERPEGGYTWLTPRAAQRYWLEQRDAGAREISYTTVMPESGLQPVTMTHTLVGEEDYEYGGETVRATVWRVTTSLMPVEAIEKVAPDGTVLLEEVDVGFGKMVSRLTTKDEALGVIEKAPELLVRTFVEPEGRIARPHEATSATLRLRVGRGAMPPLPTAGAQRFEPAGDGAAARLAIDVNDPVKAPAGDLESRAYLESSAMVDADDPLIAKLASRAVAELGHDPAARAEALRARVHGLVSEKSLGTAFATASETARTRSGDCSEHAVLLCAMLRSEDIPARVAIGLVYADSFLEHEGIFGWHMWTQALIDGRWIDLDATLPVRYHAGHVLTATTDLNDGALSAELASTLQLMGNLEIEIVEVGYE